MHPIRFAVAALAVVAACSSPSLALTVSNAGLITNWDVTPFTLANQQDTQTVNGAFTIGNNYSPISYPGIGNVPSGGEKYDLEEMHVRINGTFLEVLVISSSGEKAANKWVRGDLFISTSLGEMAIISSKASQGLTAGRVYSITEPDDVVMLQSGSGSYAGNAAIAALAGPWAVDDQIEASKLLPVTATINKAVHNYGGAEKGTDIWEYRLDLSTLGYLAGSDLEYTIHQTWGCGNDLIEVTHLAQTFITTVPTPAALPAGLALMALGFVRRPRGRN